MATNDVWQLSVRGTVHGEMHMHTLHFLQQLPTAVGNDLITLWSGAPATAYRALFPLGQTPVQLIRAAKVCGAVPLPAPTEVVPAGGSQGGSRPTSSSEPLPTFVASLVTVKGTLAGRRYSGRYFLGGLLEIDTNGNSLGGAYVALSQAYVDALKAAFVTPALPDFRLFVFSRLLANGDPNHTKGGQPDPIAARQCQDAGAPVSNLIVSLLPTTMRSRKMGHGP